MIKKRLVMWFGVIAVLMSSASTAFADLTMAPRSEGMKITGSAAVKEEKTSAKNFMERKTGRKKISAAQEEIIHKKAKEYESVLIAKMLDQAVPKGEDSMLFGGGQANSVYRSLLIDEYAKAMSDGGGLNLADKLTEEMLQMSGR